VTKYFESFDNLDFNIPIERTLESEQMILIVVGLELRQVLGFVSTASFGIFSKFDCIAARH